MAARLLLRKLEQRGLIRLPPIRHLPVTARPGAMTRTLLPAPRPLAAPVTAALAQILPIHLSILATGSDRRECAQWLAQHHYLGWNRPAGENITYRADDRAGRALAVCVWGAAAWKLAPRDEWIGWSAAQRSAGLKFLANNQRFLILPWVQVPHLGSYLLGQIQRRIRADWQEKYQHDLYLLESFVQTSLFQATIYRAANWQGVGQTQGRSRQDRWNCLELPRKSIWMAVLEPRFRKLLLNLSKP